MKRKLSQKSFEELLFLKEWNLIIADYFVKIWADPIFERFRQIIIETFEKNDLRGMRMIYKDNNGMTIDLSPNDLDKLNQILRKKFGFDLAKVNDKNLAKIKRIIERGHLKSDDEFRLLSNRVDEIYADDSKKDEVEVLNKLMGDYENSKRSKLFKRRS